MCSGIEKWSVLWHTNTVVCGSHNSDGGVCNSQPAEQTSLNEHELTIGNA